jgi:hypothetical protein
MRLADKSSKNFFISDFNLKDKSERGGLHEQERYQKPKLFADKLNLI